MIGNFPLSRIGLAALVLSIAASGPALADLQVIDSNVATYKVGTVLPDKTIFKLEAGQRVQVLWLPSNQTRVFEGQGSHSVLEPRGGSRSVTVKKKTP